MKNRNHIISIIKIWPLIRTLGFSYLAGEALNKVQSFIKQDLSVIIAIIALVIYLIVRIYTWYKTTYELREDVIVFQKILRFKITKEIMNYNGISSINSSSKLSYRIFKVSNVSITSNTSVGNERDSIDLIISSKKCDELKAAVEVSKNSDKKINDQCVEYRYGFIKYLTYATLVFIPYIFATVFIVYIIYNIKDYIFTERVFEEEILQELYIFVFGTIFALIIRGLVQTRNAINLNVVIDKSRKLVTTNSKFLSESEIKFNFDKIKVMKINTFNLFKRSAVGAGVVNSLEMGEEVVNPKLSCLLSEERVRNLLTELDVNINPLYTFKPKRVRLLYNVVYFIGVVLLLTSILIVVNLLIADIIALYIYIIVMCILFTFFILKALAIIKTEHCSINDRYVIVSKRYYENIRTIFSYDNIQMVSTNQTIIDKIFNVYNVEIGIFRYNIGEAAIFRLKTYSKDDCDKIVEYIDLKIK